MNTRLLGALKRFDRLPEVLRCRKHTRDWQRLALAYVGLNRKLPFYVHFAAGGFEFQEVGDIATFWQIFYRDVYPVKFSDRLIVDAGANIGVFTLYALLRAPNADVIAIEPAPDSCNRIRSMLRSNALGSRVALHEVALGESFGETAIQLDAGSQFRRTGGLGHPVSMVPLHSVIPPGAVVDLLKIDIEGAEYGVLNSIPRDALRRIRRIVLEFHPQAPSSAALDPLKANGFNVTSYRDDGAGYGIAWFENSLGISKQPTARI